MTTLLNGKGLLSNHFYHKTTMLYSGVFLSLFSNLTIVRPDNKTIKVPVAFNNVQKFNVANEQDFNLANDAAPRTAQSLPRIGAKFIGWRRDESRARNKRYTLSKDNKTQLERIPYQLTYQMTIRTQYIYDMFQIMEQIMVGFNPSVEVVIKDNPDLDADTSINITMVANDFNDVVEGNISDTRIIESDLTFTLDGWLYMPTQSAKGVIKKIVIDYNDLDTKEFLAETLVTPTDIFLEDKHGY